MKSSPRLLLKTIDRESADPAEHGVVSGMIGQLFCGAAAGGHQVNVEIAVAIAREGDPFSVWREASVNVARSIDSQALDVLAVFVGGPDVAEIAEDDAAVVVMRIANEPRFAAKRRNCCEQNDRCCEKSGCFFMAPDLRIGMEITGLRRLDYSTRISKFIFLWHD